MMMNLVLNAYVLLTPAEACVGRCHPYPHPHANVDMRTHRATQMRACTKIIRTTLYYLGGKWISDLWVKSTDKSTTDGARVYHLNTVSSLFDRG